MLVLFTSALVDDVALKPTEGAEGMKWIQVPASPEQAKEFSQTPASKAFTAFKKTLNLKDLSVEKQEEFVKFLKEELGAQ